jgi:hypothetical protein
MGKEFAKLYSPVSNRSRGGAKDRLFGRGRYAV